MTAFARLALWFLRDARQGTSLEHWKAWASVLLELLAHPTGLKALELLLRYFFYVAAAPAPETLRNKLLLDLGPKAEEVFMTYPPGLWTRWSGLWTRWSGLWTRWSGLWTRGLASGNRRSPSLPDCAIFPPP